jgi:hypothetical protein
MPGTTPTTRFLPTRSLNTPERLHKRPDGSIRVLGINDSRQELMRNGKVAQDTIAGFMTAWQGETLKRHFTGAWKR